MYRYIINSPWLALVIAGLLEVCWASCLKATAGFTRLGPTLLFVVSMAGSLFLLSAAVKSLPIGLAYAVWVGIGAVGTAIVAVVLHGEPMNFSKGLLLALLIGSIIGLKYTGAGE